MGRRRGILKERLCIPLALDGALLHLLKQELFDSIPDARVERVYQPSKEELVLAVRSRAGSRRLLLSCRASSPRIHFTTHAPENPAKPPMLCMLLRKHLTGAKLTAIRQPGLERVLFLDFDTTNELGDHVALTLAVEIMGRHSNLILIGEDGRIIDAVKRVDGEMSSVRMVLPVMQYVLPPQAPGRMDLTKEEPADIVAALAGRKDEALEKALLTLLLGVSPIVCRELAHYAGRGAALRSASLHKTEQDRLAFYLGKIKEILQTNGGNPVMVTDVAQGKPIDFSFLTITQYGTAATLTPFDSYSELLDGFYAERDRVDRIRHRAQDLLKTLTNASERIARKINAQKAELLQCADRERLRQYGDLLNANLYHLQKGMPVAQVDNFFEEGNPPIRIPLDPAKTPVQNAQKYYKDYRKAQTAEKILHEQIEKGMQELAYIDTVFDALSRADTERELTEIRTELAGQGYGRLGKGGRQQKAPPPLKPISFTSSDGFAILVGRNNQQNDRLTLKQAKGSDLWFHTKNIPGSHVIVCAEGREVPQRTIMEAAALAAFHSKAKDSAQVPVDYTPVKFVKKPQGAKPGMVIYTTNQTAYVTPQEDLVERLRDRE